MKARYLLAAIVLLLPACQPATKSVESLPVAEFLTSKGYHELKLNKLATGHETIEVEINGKPGLFVLDSGAGASVVNTDDLAKFDLVEDTSATHTTGAGAGGEVTFKTYKASSFKIGGQTFALDTVHALDLNHVVSAIQAATQVKVDGVIGQDVLTKYGGIIDVANSSLYLKKCAPTAPC